MRQLARSASPTDAAHATERLARLMREFKLPADAAYYYRQLERRFGAVPWKDGQTCAQFVASLRSAGNFPDAPPPVLDWPADAVRVERMGAIYQQTVPQQLSSLGSPLPFFDTHRFEVEPGTGRLEVIDGLTDELHWSLPLRNKAGTAEGGFALAQAAAHHLTLSQRGVIHSLSPVDRQVLWTRPLENRGAAQQYFGRNQTPLQPMLTAHNLSRRVANAGMPPAAGAPLGIATDEFVSFQGRRSMTVLDALTGEICWTYTGVRPDTQTLGGEEIVYLRPADKQNPLALRAADGRRLEVKNLNETMDQAVHVVGDNFVLWNLGGGKEGLRLFDPIAGKDLWTVELAKATRLSLLENNRMAVLEPSGKFALVDLSTGERRNMATIAAEDLKGKSDVYALADHINVYLILNNNPGMNANFYQYPENVPYVRVNGQIMAFEAATGKQRWKHAAQGQSLMLERMTFSPFLVFVSRELERNRNNPFGSLHLLAIDKLSGVKLLDEKSSVQPGFRSINVNANERYVELRGVNDRVRLYPVERSADPGTSGGE